MKIFVYLQPPKPLIRSFACQEHSRENCQATVEPRLSFAHTLVFLPSNAMSTRVEANKEQAVFAAQKERSRIRDG
jgi:hypothetical protein